MIDTANVSNQSDFAKLAEPYRRELQVHCYRMLGSLQDAEDLVQETLLRAWQKLDTYAGRASFRAWLYKIATNACLDALDRRPRRTMPQARQPASDPHEPLAPSITEPIWLEPIPDDLLADVQVSPEARYDALESITLAFLAALQILPPRQRAVLILRDVLDLHAEEVARVLGITVSSTNSALHRARTTMAKHYHARGIENVKAKPSDEKTRLLLERYMRAWEAGDVDALIVLFKEDAVYPMPPSPSWYQGKAAIRAFISSNILAGDARGRWKMTPTRANAGPALAWYLRDDASSTYRAFAIQSLTFEGDLLANVTTFPNPALFRFFNLPLEHKA
ncbi:MAG TPA: sigma-70 family RNA polymerase sigma factor [Anaerolineae bacterium]